MFVNAGSLDKNKHATLVVDLNTGRVLHEENADDYRNPASLVKMMTLYITFAALESKNIKMNSVLTTSANAAKMPRTNLNLKVGDKIKVKEAILALIVHSANDVAVVLAEAIAGTEKKFVQFMNMQAKALGMYNTIFQNPTGLTSALQKTTAYDLARLAIALKKDFPQYYHLFSTTKFYYKNQFYNSHNKVIKNYKGSDGIKTGYTKASGFNIVTSARNGNKNLLAIVLGGKTAQQRDARTVSLLNKYFYNSKKSANNVVYNTGRKITS
jgi:D-alanyl-D-alanine carboxypeptidase